MYKEKKRRSKKEKEKKKKVFSDANLILGVNQTVSNSTSFERDLRVLVRGILAHNVVGNRRDVMASITLSSDEQIVLQQGRILLEEALGERIDVSGNFILVSFIHIFRSIRKASSNRLIDEDKIRVVVPAERVHRQRVHVGRVCERPRPVLCKGCELARATRPSSEPENGWCIWILITSSDHPVKKVKCRSGRGKRDVT